MLNHQRSVWESATWPEPQTCQRLFSQLSGTGLQVPVAGNIPKHSSVSLAITCRSSSSVLRAIVLSKLMLRKKKNHSNLCMFIHATCYTGLRFWSSNFSYVKDYSMILSMRDHFLCLLQKYAGLLKLQVAMLLAVWFGNVVI